MLVKHLLSNGHSLLSPHGLHSMSILSEYLDIGLILAIIDQIFPSHMEAWPCWSAQWGLAFAGRHSPACWHQCSPGLSQSSFQTVEFAGASAGDEQWAHFNTHRSIYRVQKESWIFQPAPVNTVTHGCPNNIYSTMKHDSNEVETGAKKWSQ